MKCTVACEVTVLLSTRNVTCRGDQRERWEGILFNVQLDSVKSEKAVPVTPPLIILANALVSHLTVIGHFMRVIRYCIDCGSPLVWEIFSFKERQEITWLHQLNNYIKWQWCALASGRFHTSIEWLVSHLKSTDEWLLNRYMMTAMRAETLTTHWTQYRASKVNRMLSACNCFSWSWFSSKCTLHQLV